MKGLIGMLLTFHALNANDDKILDYYNSFSRFQEGKGRQCENLQSTK